ncbi:MAG: hypothetical protein JWQ23_2030 [Herminiimonas sp.]|nr:hypothetical protein [Herminiimonas sp.]
MDRARGTRRDHVTTVPVAGHPRHDGRIRRESRGDSKRTDRKSSRDHGRADILHSTAQSGNTGGQTMNPRLEHALRRSRDQKYLANKAKVDEQIDQVKAAGPSEDATERIEKLEAEKAQMLENLQAVINSKSILKILRDLKMENTKELEKLFNEAWNAYEKMQKESCTKQIWTFLAGWAANWFAFGLGNQVALSVAKIWPPIIWFVPIISGITWQITEPTFQMIRSSTVSNPNTSKYLSRQRWAARSFGDYFRAWAGMKLKEYVVLDPVTKKEIVRTAAQMMEGASWFELFRGKVATDDAPYFWYTGLGFTGQSLTGAFPERLNGWSEYALKHGLGALSGADTMLCMQAARAREAFVNNNGGKEDITKSREIWGYEARYLDSFKSDLENRLTKLEECKSNANKTTSAKIEFEFSIVKTALKVATIDLDKAVKKSSIFTSYFYELSTLFQAKGVKEGSDLDVPGKRMDTLCSFLGKMSCLLPVAIAQHLTIAMRGSSDIRIKLLGYLIVSTVLICPGFFFRLEWAALYRVLIGGGKGMKEAIDFWLDGYAKYIDETVGAENDDEDWAGSSELLEVVVDDQSDPLDLLEVVVESADDDDEESSQRSVRSTFDGQSAFEEKTDDSSSENDAAYVFSPKRFRGHYHDSSASDGTSSDSGSEAEQFPLPADAKPGYESRFNSTRGSTGYGKEHSSSQGRYWQTSGSSAGDGTSSEEDEWEAPLTEVVVHDSFDEDSADDESADYASSRSASES